MVHVATEGVARRSPPRSRLVRRFGEEARIEFRPASAFDEESATLVPVAGGRPLSPFFLAHLIDVARSALSPTARLLTPALTPEEAQPFLHAGFQVRSELALLIHAFAKPVLQVDVTPRPDSGRQHLPVALERGKRTDRPTMLAVDARAFPPGWAMDEPDLDLAINATPTSRLRVARDQSGQLLGFAVTGRSGRRGYLQRLSVDPSVAGRGVGTALVVDTLKWCRRHRVQRVVVNTQLDNHRALALYRRLGFVEAPVRLSLLTTPELGHNVKPPEPPEPPELGHETAATTEPETTLPDRSLPFALGSQTNLSRAPVSVPEFGIDGR